MRMRGLLALTIVALLAGACDNPSDPTGGGEEPRAARQHRSGSLRYDIVHLPSLGGTVAGGNGIASRGQVVGSSNLSGDEHAHAVVWRHGRLTDLGTLGGPNSSVAWPGVSRSGRLVAGIAETEKPGGEAWSCQFFFPSATGNQCLGFVWRHGEMRALPPWPGGTNSFATGVNSRGQVVGWAENGVEDPTCNAPVRLQFRAAVWDTRTGEMTELPPLAGDSASAATAIDERGRVVGISGDCANAVGGFSAKHAVLWKRDGAPEDIGDLGGDAWHTPMDINERGEIVGFSNPSEVEGAAFGIQAFYWSRHQGIVPIGTLEGQPRSQALGINNRGQVVGQSSGGPDGRRAFLWEDGVLRDLNALVAEEYEGTLLSAGHIDDAGVVTGVALDANSGDEVAFVATPRRGWRR